MKKNIIFSVLFLLSFNSFSDEWKSIEPMDVYSQSEYETLIKENYECNQIRISFGCKRMYITYMDEEPEYIVSKSNPDSKRILLAFYDVPEIDDFENSGETNQKLQEVPEQFLDSMCIDTIDDDIFSSVIKNDYGIAYQGADKKGRRYLLHAGIRSVDIGCYKLGKLEISKGLLEASENFLYYDAPLYFWDKKTKKLICLSPLKKQLVNFDVTLNNPAFVYDTADEETGFMNLYVVDYEDDGETPILDKAWICKGGEIIKLGE